MLDFDELKKALADEDFEARKADLVAIDSLVEMPEGVTVRIFDDYFPEGAFAALVNGDK